MFRRNQEEYQGRLNGEYNEYPSVLNGEESQEIYTLTDAVENLKETCAESGKEIRKINFAPFILFIAFLIIGGTVILPKIIDIPTIQEALNIPIVTKSETGIVIDTFYEDTDTGKTFFYVTIEREVVIDGEATTETDDYRVPYKHYIQMGIGTVVYFEDDELVSYEPVNDASSSEVQKE